MTCTQAGADVRTLAIPGKQESGARQYLDSAYKSNRKCVCNATFKTATFFNTTIKDNGLPSVAFGQLYQQDITLRDRDSKEVSVLRRRWLGYSIKDIHQETSQSVLLKYDEITYPISTASVNEIFAKSVGSSLTKKSKKPVIHRYRKCILFLMFFILAAVVIGRSLLLQNECNKSFDAGSFRHILNENVFGQDEIKKLLIRTIESMNSSLDSDMKTLIFSGSSGVGKTYVASLVAQHFPWPENVHYLASPIHSEMSANDVHNHLSSCGYNLIIIDDLKQSDMNFVLELKGNYETLHKDKFLKILLILIFNVEQNLSTNSASHKFDGYTEMSERMVNEGKGVNHLQFSRLYQDHIIKCIEKLLSKRGVTEPQIISSSFYKSIMHPYLLEGGCKRILSKLNIFLEMHEQKKLVTKLW